MTSPRYGHNLALIGGGYWGKNLARNFHALGTLHTLCDTCDSTLRTYGEDYSAVRKTDNINVVLSDPEIKRVAIAAPAALHYKLARSALEAGKDVFVEKPLCLDEREGEELVALAEAKARILMVGHLLRYHPCIIKLQELIAAGELGKLFHITSNRLNLGKIRREENALWSFAPHDISVILSVLGGQVLDEIRCVGEAYLNKNIPDITLTTLRVGDVQVQIYVSWLNPFKEQKLTIVGSKGLAVFDDTRPWSEKLVIHRDYLTWANGHTPTPNKGNGEAVAVQEQEPLQNECRHFLDCCNERTTPLTDGKEGLRVLKILHAAQRSLDGDGEVVRIEHLTPAEAPYYNHPTAVIDNGAVIGRGTKIWHFCHVESECIIGEKCNFGQNVYISSGVVIGRNVKVQNNVSVYTGAVIEDDVFLGPSCVLTNVTNPRSQVSRRGLYEKTLIRRGATVGANATIVCGVTLGRYCFIAAGSVVVEDVPDYALMMGVPAQRKGWMSRHGHPLKADGDGIMRCRESGLCYKEVAPGVLKCLDLDEDAPLPPMLTVGRIRYDEVKLAV